MRGYKEPGFKERVATANSAKAKALEKLKNMPKPSEAELAERGAHQRAKETDRAEKRAAVVEAREIEKSVKKQAEREIAEARAAADAQPKLPTAEELKAARDARYAARKTRKR